MKIAYVSLADYGCPPPENRIQAALWMAAQVIREMTKRGHETTYIGVDGSTADASSIISMGKGFFDVYDYEKWAMFGAARRIETFATFTNQLLLFTIETLRRLSVDIVHFHTSPPIAMLPYTRYISFPKVITFHDPLYMEYQNIFHSYSDVTNNYFVSISDAQRKHIDIKNSIETIHNGIPIENYSFRQDSGEYLLFMGRIKRDKGIQDALTVAQRMKLPFHIDGRSSSGEVDYYNQEIVPLNNGTSIVLNDVLGGEKKIMELSHASALLFPVQWEEPFGLVMIEAMACGTPVIAYNRGSVPEVVKDGVTGFIIDPDNEDRPGKGTWKIKKQGIDGLIEAVSRIGEIDRRVCRKHVEEYFTAEYMATGYEKLYEKILKERSS